MRKIITLVSREQAVIGHRFRVVSIPDECKSCKLYAVCLGKLTPGRSYEVIEIRPSLGQRCKITGEEVVPVVAAELPIVGLVPLNKALEGAIVTFEGECKGCKDCPDNIVKPGEKIKIIRVLGRTRCKDRDFATVEFYILEAPLPSELGAVGTYQDHSRAPLLRRPLK
ncbi:conserved hypothetical protein [Pyrobaculum islandicum DSM 4184]|uniref:UPF0179 protein Pisl_0688 n=1 Tax=Pyrobaculum islandicum (strain DSM 4184 / JCM 9189 / GEO3) TaxID=384616 RepID=Y688_PYRIL|nr:UPF0179 family protein [Pyrobaculum islandicum]A1RSD4.1 RecName: Full=UPF0179 protein Pisl_0688 [Pyrobaculum islandicum DSM 4184]ABL87866.1 conserved hypothetical protein [Pyrobaculum islandicum DSM 4184]